MTIDDHAKKIAAKFARLQRAATQFPDNALDEWKWRNGNNELAEAAIDYANSVRNARRVRR